MPTLAIKTHLTVTRADGVQHCTDTITESYTTAATTDNFEVKVYTVPTATTNEQLVLGMVATAKRVVIFSDYAVTVKIGTTGGEAREIPAGGAIQITAAAGQANYYVTNASGSTATLRAVLFE